MMKHTKEVQQLLDQMKTEIAIELGLDYGADVSSRDNGKIGGEITRRLIELGEQKLLEMHHETEQQTQNLKQPFYQENDTSKTLYLQ